jgi:ferritin-like metal-binding protein YciE
MEGVLKEGDEVIEEAAEDEVRDAGLIAAAQRVEHYEMAGSRLRSNIRRVAGGSAKCAVTSDYIDRRIRH